MTHLTALYIILDPFGIRYRRVKVMKTLVRWSVNMNRMATSFNEFGLIDYERKFKNFCLLQWMPLHFYGPKLSSICRFTTPKRKEFDSFKFSFPQTRYR